MNSLNKLPVDDFIDTIQNLLKGNLNLVITAAPGAGKTTRLPPALSKLFQGKTRVLQPRRMAAIAAAHRIAEENSLTLGQEIGYQVRFANKTTAKTKLIFMTEALLTRRLLQDPELADTELVILDEFHERSLNVDLAIGLIRELQELGREIRIVVMSATLEADKISEYLGNAPIVSIPGKLFPMNIHHQKEQQILQTHPIFFEKTAQVIRQAFSNSKRDLLVFLPGVGEIERLKGHLQDWADQNYAEICTLHGSLKIEEQRLALQSGSRRRIILSTNIAESSVTVDGVDTVIDTGLAKVLKQDPKTGFSRLELTRISLASAVQRAGRSARQYPGHVYRLWSHHDELNFPKSDIPEVQRSDLSECLLFLSAQGITSFQNFHWFEKPPISMLTQAENFLQLSGALTPPPNQNQITELGSRLLKFPLPVRLAKLVLTGFEIGHTQTSAQIAAILQERDLIRKEQSHEYLGDRLESDIIPRVEILDQYQKTKKSRSHSTFLLQNLDQSVENIVDVTKESFKSAVKMPKSTEPISEMLISAYTDRLCRRRGQTDRALMVGRRGVKIHKDSLVKNSEFFLALQGVEGSSESETLVNLAHGLTKEFVFSYFIKQIEKKKELIYNEEKVQFYIQEYRTLYDLPLEEPKMILAQASDVADRLPEVLNLQFEKVLKENEGLSIWWQRLSFLLQQKTDLEIDLYSIRIRAFQMAALGEHNLKTVIEKDLVYFFESVTPNEIVQTLRNELPDKLKVPSGSLIRIHYPLDKAPYVEVRIQEIFGLKESPRLLQNTIPLTFHLLGPNYRPVQLTSNLESFWKNGYAEVRKELRLRYPKHQWPEDPNMGIPEAKGRRRT